MISIKTLAEKLQRLAETINLKNISTKALGGAVLLFITFMVIILSIENYRSEKKETTPEYELKAPDDTQTPQKENGDIEEETTVNLGAVQNTDILIEQMEKRSDSSAEASDFPIVTKEISESYKITWDVYDGETCKFFKVDTSDNESLPDYFDIEIDGSGQKAVFVVMGYIFSYTEDENLQMMSSSGEKLLGNLKDRKFQMQNQRDKDGNPVILDENGYSIFDMEQKTLVESDFDPILDGRGFVFSYSRDFGEPVNSSLVRFYSESYKKWGYKDIETDKTVIAPIYNEAYNFNNGYAVAVKYEYKRWQEIKRLYFIDETGKVLNKDYFPPDDTLFKSKRGFLYFDHGLTRALARDYTWTGTVLNEFPYLCYPDGTVFQIPPDYTLTAYSEGMILLEKAGKYGFMDYMGNWVVQPIYSYAAQFNEGVAVVGLSDTQKALIDLKGNLLTNFEYQHITDCSDGVIAMYSAEKGWVVLNKMKLQ